MDKIKYILNQPDKEEEKNGQESNRSNYDDEYSNNGTNREDMESGRDNMQSNRTDQGMNLNDLVVEMYEELHIIVGALPNLENMRLKVQELVENFRLINETLIKYQVEMKEIVNDEVEKMKKELVMTKKTAGFLIKKTINSLF